MPFARKSDPTTSHEAAASVTDVTATQQAILKVLARPRTDEELIQAYRRMKNAPFASDSGIRSRRSELAAKGLLAIVGESRTQSGRKTRIWQVSGDC
jgi:hypothetical protein